MSKDDAIEWEKTFNLLGGRTVEITTYKNGDVGFKFDRSYVLSEHKTFGADSGTTLIRLSPGRQGSAVDQNWLANKGR